jgi:hypothetical protein
MVIMTDKNKDKKNIGQQKLCITANHIGYPLPIETALAMSATTVCIPIAPRKQPAMTIPHLHEVDIGHDINVLLKIIVVNCH